MKIQILSDFQADVDKNALNKLYISPEADLLVIAGDYYPPLMRSINSLKEAAKKIKIIYVPGNRDFYFTKMYEHLEEARKEAEESNIILLQNNSVVIEGIKFIGATLWTDNNDFSLSGRLNDFKHIKKDESNLILPKEILEEHQYSINFIKEELLLNDYPSVIITHHAPHFNSINPVFIGEKLNSSKLFASDLSDILESNISPSLWIHGGTHYPVDYMVEETRIISNPLGYKHEKIDFNINKIIDIEPDLQLNY